MGRNAASKVFWTNVGVSASDFFTWFCQQHAKFDSPTVDSTNLKTHLGDHGNAEQ